jgi:DNA-binding HxlR family transcriptional regulator
MSNKTDTRPPRPRRVRIATAPPPKRHPYNQWTPDARALDLIGDKWTLLIIRDLATGPRRFVELQRVLPGISTEQLRSRLNRMVADELLTRERFREVPPRVDYSLTERARGLLPVLGELAKWGFQYAWGEPRDDEDIDISGIFRSAPGTIPTDGPSGVVELTITYPDDREPRSTTITIADGSVVIQEREAPEADAQVAGIVTDWIDALGPAMNRSGIRLAGDERLARFVLDAISGSAQRVPETATS